MSQTTIAVIGAGFSGTLLSLHLLRRCGPGTQITLIERNSQFGRGQAYSTGNASHVLNVPAGRMSAYHGQPTHFLEWAQKRQGEASGDGGLAAGSFVPRRLYGDYIRALLKEELKRAPERRLDLLRGDVRAIDRSGARLGLHLDRGRVVHADFAVLAVGNFPPASMPVADPSFYDTAFYRPDPWACDALAGLDPTAPVLLIGTGLTMVDVVISLLDQGHAGPIYALSRRGLLPHRHASGAGQPIAAEHAFPTVLTELLRFMREEAQKARRAGANWQPIVDEIRPFMQDVWQIMSPADKARFVRHLRPWWDVHRHRMAPAVADRIEAARASGQLQIIAGRVQSYAPEAGSVRIAYRPRGTDGVRTLAAARVINCSGPTADYDRISDGLIRSLLADGTARPDFLRLGLDVTGTCALLSRSGAISRRLFAVGPVTKGAFWEMTAVPDIRRQCEFLAQHLSGLVKPAAAAPAAERPLTFSI
ncbi:MAG: FAD/NAD(P)-binding protein [Acetobacteraceae bacterium]|nr:FAD/NAD(P)-binding protein [Acetobacteraceae bacterium]